MILVYGLTNDNTGKFLRVTNKQTKSQKQPRAIQEAVFHERNTYHDLGSVTLSLRS